MMRTNGTIWIVASAGALGAALAAAVPAFALDAPPGRAWVFGAGLGFFQSVIGLFCYARVRTRTATDAMLLWGLGSGVARMIAILSALAFALHAGFPTAATVCSLLLMYFTMMAAEIHLVLRAMPPPTSRMA